MSVAIRVENLSKSYLIHHQQREPYVALRDVLASGARNAWRRLRHPLGGYDPSDPGQEEFWALRDLSFEVEQGDRVGIIGRNGAGKSTLLKLLSRITEPTTGRLSLNGRVASLLEVGTGFHPELTGRENIFLNGAVLGMSRVEIKRKFDEIVAFAEVERFLDTPVKRYSSGMYVRLAFAVAAHLEAEILVVDEVLAVGDAQFQRKCLSKMSEVAGTGRTVLFVSHNMGAIRKLCNSGIFLASGEKVMEGSAHEVVQAYLHAGGADGSARVWEGSDAPGDETARLRAVRICQPIGVTAPRVDMQQPFQIEIEYEAFQPFGELNVALVVSDEHGGAVLHTTHNLSETDNVGVQPGRYVSTAELPAHALNAGHYWLDVHADEPYKRMLWSVEQALRFEVELTCPLMSRYPAGSYRGVLGPRLVRWHRTAAPPARQELLTGVG